MWSTIQSYWANSAFALLTWQHLVMFCIGGLFIYLAVRKKYEPLLLLPIGFGILVGNIPYDSTKLSLGTQDGPVPEADIQYIATSMVTMPDGREFGFWEPIPKEYAATARALAMEHEDVEQNRVVMVDMRHWVDYEWVPETVPSNRMAMKFWKVDGKLLFANIDGGDENNRYPVVVLPKQQDINNSSVLYLISRGVAWGVFPALVFLGVGALTDFGPLLANPITVLLGAAAQFGIFLSLLGALALGFDIREAASIGIIGGADGPTAIFTSTMLAPDLVGPIALAAYSYMAMVPIIQPPIMRLLTSKRERLIRMEPPKNVTRLTRILFPLLGLILTTLIANAALPLLGMLFLGNLLRESMVTERLAKTTQTAFVDIVTILLGLSVGAKTQAASFLNLKTLGIFVIGILAFAVATSMGVLFAKLMNRLTRKPINPLIGAAGVSAVPMAARVVQKVGQEEDPQNFLLMHAMGPNVAGVIGSAIAAGVLLSSLAN